MLTSLLNDGVDAHDLAGIPCYFEQYSRVRTRWAFEAFHLLWHIEAFAGDSKLQAENPKLRRLTRDRLKANGRANLEHLAVMRRLLAPLGADQIKAPDYFNYVSARGGASSELAKFYPNLLRDWSWETDENQKTFALLKSVLPAGGPLGKVLVLGAGACRLAYDLHVHAQPELTVVTDINPLMFLCAKKVIAGETVELFDFPANPVSREDYGAKRVLRAPAPLLAGFHFALTDATRPVFKPGTFDTVVTPWLIDVLPTDIHEFFPIVNQLLKPGGTWLNLGPLLFNVPFARRYAEEEVMAIAEKSGFSVEARGHETLPYLQSPGNGSSRSERVLTFRASKTDEVSTLEKPSLEAPDTQPAWLKDPSLPVEIIADLRPLVSAQAAFGEVLGLVDGKRSLKQIAAAVSAKFEISEEQALTFAERGLRGLVVGTQSSPIT